MAKESTVFVKIHLTYPGGFVEGSMLLAIKRNNIE